MSKTQREKERILRRKQRAESDFIKLCPLPSHIGRIPFDSEEWEELVNGPNGEFWKNGKGIVKGLGPNGTQELRQPTFKDVQPEEAKAMLKGLITDERMLPIEEKFSEKFGSYKPLGYLQWRDKVLALWKDTTWNPDQEYLAWAKEHLSWTLRMKAEELFGVPHIIPSNPSEIITKVTKGRNSGWPFFTSKWSQDPKMVKTYLANAKYLLAGRDTLSGTPHILFKRVQPNGDIPKMRAVECPPKHDSIAGKCLTDHFISMFKEIPEFYGFNGNTRVHEVLGEFMTKRLLVESDFSSFDANCQEIMPHVFEVIKSVVPMEYHAYLDITLNYYQHSLLLTPEGILYGKDGRINGLNSGDAWTSVIGTLANALCVRYTMARMGMDRQDYHNLSFGDDIALACDEFDSIEFERVMAELGMECNQSKQNVSEGPTAYFSFLGFYHFRDRWQQGNQGIFPIMRIAPGLYYKEYFLDIADAFASLDLSPEEREAMLKASKKGIDMVGIVAKLNNCHQHPDFERLVELMKAQQNDGLNTEMFMPFSKLTEMRLNGRTSRNQGLANSPAVQYLYYLEGLLDRAPEASKPTMATVEAMMS